MVLMCWIFVLDFVSPKLHFCLSVVTLHGSDGKGDVDLLCCIFLLSCKVENKCERRGFFLLVLVVSFCKNAFPFSFMINEVLLHSLFL